MTHMLKMTTLQFCHPIIFFILVIINNRLLHLTFSFLLKLNLIFQPLNRRIQKCMLAE